MTKTRDLYPRSTAIALYAAIVLTALLEVDTLWGQRYYRLCKNEEIEDLINKNVYPANKEDLKVEEKEQSSALGSMGLKPKIVH